MNNPLVILKNPDGTLDMDGPISVRRPDGSVVSYMFGEWVSPTKTNLTRWREAKQAEGNTVYEKQKTP